MVDPLRDLGTSQVAKPPINGLVGKAHNLSYPSWTIERHSQNPNLNTLKPRLVLEYYASRWKRTHPGTLAGLPPAKIKRRVFGNGTLSRIALLIEGTERNILR